MLHHCLPPRRPAWTLAIAAAVVAAIPAYGQDEPFDPAAVTLSEVIDAPYYVIWDGATLRAQPDAASAAVERLEFGDTVYVTGAVDDDWYRAEAPGGGAAFVWEGAVAPRQLVLPGAAQGFAPEPGSSLVHGPSDDNELATANDLGLLGDSFVTGEGMVGPSDPSDIYVFELTDWTDLEIRIEGLAADADLELLDVEGYMLQGSYQAGAEAELIQWTAGPGLYYVEVYMYEGETDYALSVSATPGEPPPPDGAGDTHDTASDLGQLGAAPTVAQEWVGVGADGIDYFRFEVTERATVTVDLTGLAADADLSIEDDFGSVIDSSNNAESQSEYVEVVLEPGVYFAGVTAYAGSTDFTLSLTAAPAGPAPADGAGNSAAAARSLGAVGPDPVTVTDWVGLADREDWYSVAVEGTAQLSVTMSPATADADLEVLAVDGSQVLGSSALAGTSVDSVDLTVDPGTYLIRVVIFERETNYDLTVSANPSTNPPPLPQ